MTKNKKKKRAKPMPGRAQGRPRAPAAMQGSALRTARETAGWSLREMAKKLKLSAPALLALEAGEANISASRAKAIRAVFDKGKKAIDRAVASLS